MTKRRDEGVEVGKTNGSTAPSDSLVLFGVTGDLAHKMIFPALYAMAKRAAQTGFVATTEPLAIGRIRRLCEM